MQSHTSTPPIYILTKEEEENEREWERLETLSLCVSLFLGCDIFYFNRLLTVCSGNPYWRGWLSTVDLLVLTSSDQLLLVYIIFLNLLTKLIILMGSPGAFPFSKDSVVCWIQTLVKWCFVCPDGHYRGIFSDAKNVRICFRFELKTKTKKHFLKQ